VTQSFFAVKQSLWSPKTIHIVDKLTAEIVFAKIVFSVYK